MDFEKRLTDALRNYAHMHDSSLHNYYINKTGKIVCISWMEIVTLLFTEKSLSIAAL